MYLTELIYSFTQPPDPVRYFIQWVDDSVEELRRDVTQLDQAFVDGVFDALVAQRFLHGDVVALVFNDTVQCTIHFDRVHFQVQLFTHSRFIDPLNKVL